MMFFSRKKRKRTRYLGVDDAGVHKWVLEHTLPIISIGPIPIYSRWVEVDALYYPDPPPPDSVVEETFEQRRLEREANIAARMAEWDNRKRK